MGEGEGYARRSARVLVVDSAGRALLLRYLVDVRDPDAGHGWCTPGGGVHDGEPLAQAAARELAEEIGLVADPDDLGRPVAYTAGYAEFDWATGVFREDIFYYRVDAHDVDVSRMEALERSYHGGHRWWTVDELRSTADTVFPLRLAELLTDLLAGRVPAEPLRLPWHH